MHVHQPQRADAAAIPHDVIGATGKELSVGKELIEDCAEGEDVNRGGGCGATAGLDDQLGGNVVDVGLLVGGGMGVGVEWEWVECGWVECSGVACRITLRKGFPPSQHTSPATLAHTLFNTLPIPSKTPSQQHTLPPIPSYTYIECNIYPLVVKPCGVDLHVG